mgnify:FL=1
MSNSTLLNSMKAATNYEYTTNGAVGHKTTGSKVLDMFATGAAMRERSDADVILLFKNAMAEDEVLALKCLFWIRDIRGGQGERRFFRVCMKWLANYNTNAALRNLQYVPEFGRWDDLYAFVGTKCEKVAFKMIHDQLMLDLDSKTPSLLGKWLKSENASSKDTRILGDITRKHLKMTHKQYRKMLSILRTRINIVEKLMSENRWDEIEFDKIPSKAGFIYKNAFARRDITKEKYEKFAKDENTTVNAQTLYPYEVVQSAINVMGSTNYWRTSSKVALDNVDRLMVNKYWDNLTDYFKGATLNALCMIDTSGSMEGTPINVATSLGLYCAERAGGPFANHYISFSSHPQLIETTGVDFCDKVDRIVRTNLCENTNIEAAFDLVLQTALASHCKQSDLPEYILVVSDMQFDGAQTYSNRWSSNAAGTLMENIAKKWNVHGYEMPKLIYWNVNACGKADIPMIAGNVSFVSGFSPSIFQSILTGKTGYQLLLETLNNPRYDVIH